VTFWLWLRRQSEIAALAKDRSMLHMRTIEFRPNDLASPRKARLPDDIPQNLDEPTAGATCGLLSICNEEKGSYEQGHREVV
jgi:hypothetical protein